jgi:signal transduction histidine kinase
MSITIQEKDPLNFMIQFEDTGIGIESENISKIFTYGFTTKKSGHGFGLYFCMHFASEMGGSLTVSSQGVGKGAKFTLILPYDPPV